MCIEMVRGMKWHTREKQLNNLTTFFFAYFFLLKCPKRLKWQCHWHSFYVVYIVCKMKWHSKCHSKIWNYDTKRMVKRRIKMPYLCRVSCCVFFFLLLSTLLFDQSRHRLPFWYWSQINCMFWHIRYNIKTNCKCIKRLAPRVHN